LSVRERQGILLCLLSAAGFGAMAIFAKLAYRAGLEIPSLLVARFAIAAAILWVIVAIRGARLPPRRTVMTAIGLGAIGYALQAGGYFAAVERLDASLVALLLYTYPTLVFLGALALRRESATRRRVGALVLATGGTVLVLAGGGGGDGAIDSAGVAFALGAALAYTGYILVADRAVGGADPFVLTAIILTAAAVSVGVFTVATGGPHLGAAGTDGWAAIGAVIVVSTVLPVVTFLLGLERVGPSTASIVSTAEPVVTVALAMAVFGETLGPVQAVGGALVVGAVVALNAAYAPRRWPFRSRRRSSPSSPAPAPRSPRGTGGPTSPSGTDSAPSPSSTAATCTSSPATARTSDGTSPS
jgi:drug/metabolite transporter (DMT)-like permease